MVEEIASCGAARGKKSGGSAAAAAGGAAAVKSYRPGTTDYSKWQRIADDADDDEARRRAAPPRPIRRPRSGRCCSSVDPRASERERRGGQWEDLFLAPLPDGAAQ
jgi:hypothetical protein